MMDVSKQTLEVLPVLVDEMQERLNEMRLLCDYAKEEIHPCDYWIISQVELVSVNIAQSYKAVKRLTRGFNEILHK